jgi:L-amino acid N-acyltransferase YncA
LVLFEKGIEISMNNLNIREVTNKDEFGILSIRNHPDNYKWFFDNSPVSPEIHHKWFMERISTSQFCTLVAEINGEVIGIAFLNDFRGLAPKISINISPEFSNKGVGVALLKELIQRSKTADIKFLTAEILKANLISFQFFLKNNFILVDVEARMLDGEKSDVLVLSLKLSD